MFSLFLTSRSNAQATKQSGFGLIELIISIGIAVLVMTVIFVRQSSYNGTVLLRNEAYEIALAIREVQFSSVSASSDTGNFRSIVGIYFNQSEDQDDTYRIFSEQIDPANNNDTYFWDVDNEFGLQGNLDPRFEISEVATSNAGGYNVDEGLSIIFKRPNFDAIFTEKNGAISRVSAQSAEIKVAERADPTNFRTITITRTGQISVQ